ncbi:hypothetical protein LCGC14_1037470 [marine sediment metagenome]|uniref:Uncharacterized protein n=1 Tax=marine sediment metagenome TaxID=412755 RepID=A0A0F9MXE5_9ZZZZ
MLENLRQNKILIEKGKKYDLFYFLIESDKKIDLEIEIGNIVYLYTLNHIDYNRISEEGLLLNEIKRICLSEKSFDKQTKSYVLVIKIVKLTQKEVTHPVTKLSQALDPEIGIGIAPSDICEDLLNILALYFESWFKLIKQLSTTDKNEEYSLIKKDYKKIAPSKQGKDLTNHLITICSLREDQFYLIQKSLSRLNQSLKSVDDDIELGLVLLVSTIENLSRKYGEIEEVFNEDLEFYLKLKKIFNNQKYIEVLKGEIVNELFTEIGNSYVNLSYLKTKAKFKNFCVIYTSSYLQNEKFEEMIKNLYDVRSKILHAGKSLIVDSRNKFFLYNLQTRGGNVKNFSGKKGNYAELVRIPSYNELLRILSNIIRNFVHYLFSVKDDKEDKKLYKKSDIVKRNMVVASINKEGYKPGYIVNLNRDFYKKVDFIELTGIKNRIKEIEGMISENKLKEALGKVELILAHQDFSMEFYYFRFACYLKIKLLHDLDDFDGCLQIFEDYQIKEINVENILSFNFKAYCLAKLDDFQGALNIIDEVILKAKEDELKACFFDSKGDFYQLAGDYQNAIIFYNKSLEYKQDPPISFHETTLKKLKECQKQLE